MKKAKGQSDRFGLGVLPYPSGSGNQAVMRVATTVGSAAVGAVAGAAVGRPAMLLGLVLMGAGAYLDRTPVIAAGAGMAFTSGTVNQARAAEAAASGKPGMLADGKARILSLLDEVKGKSYVGDLLKKGGQKLAGLGAMPTNYSYGAPAYDPTPSYQQAMNQIGAPMGAVPLELAGLEHEVDLAGGPTVEMAQFGSLSPAEAVLA